MNAPVHLENTTSYNDTVAEYPREKSLPHFVNECAKKYANKVAIKFHGRNLTYKEVYESSNK
ncbi:MAG: hypothetical protein ABIN13_08120, partial [Mucilaginibacter sp.]